MAPRDELTASFSPDYATARARFRRAAEAAGFALARYPIGCEGPDGSELTIDVAVTGAERPRRVLVVSSGTHGVEGYFGSAVQLSALQGAPFQRSLPPDLRVVLIHALNPFGFAWIRRVNEDNVDLNRNFVRRGRSFEGAPEAYARLDPLLNPRSAPTSLEPFWIKAALELSKHGFSQLKNAVAQGQYEFPEGLFFGGKGESASRRILAEHARDWVGAPERVIHVDFHTGLGKWGRYTLALDLPAHHPRVAALGREFGGTFVQGFEPKGTLYEIKGALGNWLEEQFSFAQYDCLLAEFGTYNALRVLGALRRENRAHFYARTDRALTRAAKTALFEVFCPRSPAWRELTVRRGLEVVERALVALSGRG